MDFLASFPEKLYFCSKNIFCGMNGIEEIEVAEIAKFTPVELKEYEDSLKTYRDLKNSLDTAEEKGRVEGRENEKIATIQRLFASGASVDIIAIATGMTEADVKLLINDISKYS